MLLLPSSPAVTASISTTVTFAAPQPPSFAAACVSASLLTYTLSAASFAATITTTPLGTPAIPESSS